MLICEHIACTHCNATNDQDAQIESRGSNNYTPLPHLPHLASGTDTQSITTHATFAIAVLPLRVTKTHILIVKNTIPQQLIAGRQHYTQNPTHHPSEHSNAQFATPTGPTSAVMHVPAEPQHLPPTPDTSRLHTQHTIVSIPIVSPVIRSESARAEFLHQLSFDSVPSHKTPKQRLRCIHSPATSESR